MADTKLLIETSAKQVKMADGTTVENKMYNHTHTKSNITDFPTTMKNPNALTISLNSVSQGGYDGSTAKSINITASAIGAAVSSHTHNYAGSSTAGGAATSANKLNSSLSISINDGETEDTDLFTFNGSSAKSINLTPDLLGAANASHTHTKSQITDFPTALKNPSALTINGTAYDGSAAKTFSLATSDHTHNYAGSSSAGGAATSANKVNTNLVIKLNGGTSEGTNLFTFNGSTAKTINITPSSIGAALSSHTHSYAGSSSAGGAANSVANALTISLNGTSQGAYNGSAAKSINVTPSAIGAAASSHTHTESDISGTISASKISGVLSLDNIPKGALERVVTVADDTARYALTTDSIQLGDTVKVTSTGLMYIVVDESKLNSADGYMEYTAGSATSVPWSGVTGKPSSMKNPNALTINGTAYDGSAAVSLSLATSGHTHNYAGSSSAGGVANSAAKVTNALTVKLNGGSTEGTNLFTFDGSAAKSVNITASSIGAAASSHTHSYAGSSSAGGAATSANKVNSSLAIKLNGGATEGTDLFTFNGAAAKTVDITAAGIGAAASDHTHNYAGSSSAGGAANSVANNMVVKLNGGSTEGTNLFTFNGSTAKSINITASAIGAAASSHTHNYAGSSSAGGAAMSANKVNSSLSISVNGGTTEDTDLFTFNGSLAKSINLTYELLGAAASSHTHTRAQITDFPTMTINGTLYDGTENITLSLATSDHTHNYAGSSSAGGAATSVMGTLANPETSTTYSVPFHTGMGTTGSKELLNNADFNVRVMEGTADKAGCIYLTLGNSTSVGTAGNKEGCLRFYGQGSSIFYLCGPLGESSGTYTARFPLASGTVALTTSTVSAANKLSTARTIDGVSFDGSAAITHYGTCSTASGTATKEVSCTGFSLVTGARIIVKFSNENTSSSAKLNVNSTGAKSIKYGADGNYYVGSTSSGKKSIRAGGLYEFVYDGTNWVLMGQDSSTYAKYSYSTWTNFSETDQDVSIVGAGVTTATSDDYFALQRGSKAKVNPYTGALTCVNLTVTGTITQSSDERLKDNFESLSEDFIKAYNELNVLSFVFKERKENDPRAIGVVAQQVLEVFDKYGIDAKEYGIVVERKDGYLGVNYEHLDSLSIMVNQKQQEKINVLEDRLKSLEELVYSMMNK